MFVFQKKKSCEREDKILPEETNQESEPDSDMTQILE